MFGRRKHDKRMAQINRVAAPRPEFPSDSSAFESHQRTQRIRKKKERLEGFGFQNRRNLTSAEQSMEKILRELGWRFNVEHPYRSFIFDFYVAAYRLVIEVDGGYHLIENQHQKDKRRDRELVKRGFMVVRLTNEQVINFPRKVKATILARLQIGEHAKVLRCVLPSRAYSQETATKHVAEITKRLLL